MACYVIVDHPEEKIGFILCNHLAVRPKGRNFTLDEIAKELEKYNIKNKKKEIQEEIYDLLESGMCIHTVDGYRYIDTRFAEVDMRFAGA